MRTAADEGGRRTTGMLPEAGEGSEPTAVRSEGEAVQRLLGIFHDLPAGVAVLAGPDHVFEFANVAYLQLVGGREVEGLPVAAALPETVAQGFLDLLDHVYATGELVRGHERRIVLERAGRSEEVFVDFTYQPVHGAGGEVEGILVHAIDVTPSVRAREQLRTAVEREQEDRFRQAIDSMIDTVMIAEPVRGPGGAVVDFTIEFVNEGHDEVGGRRASELTGRRFTEVWPAIGASGLLDAYTRVVETGEPLVIDELAYHDEVESRAVTGTFDIHATRLGAALFVVWRDVGERVARERALAESRAQLNREHQAVTLLQDAILPRELPPIAGADVAAEYLAASTDLQVGGDWFDVLALPDGSVAVTVGDVAGKGIHAAQVMAHLRTAGRVAALAGQDAAGVLTAQNALLQASGFGPFATAVVALYDPATGALSWASAGHLPPLFIRDAEARFAPIAEHPPLGIEVDPGYEVNVTMLAPGDRMVLYTDGLVERRAESITDGLERLRSLAPVGGDAASACARLMEWLGIGGTRGDDVCVLALDRPEAVDPH
jgi:PAS domain-containing protein